MKIQYLINSLAQGGAERITITLVNQLSKMCDSTKLYTIESNIFYDLKNIHYDSILNKKIFNNKIIAIFLIPYILFKYYIVTKKNDPDILISALEISNFITIIVANMLCKKSIITIHTNPELMFNQKTYYGKLHNYLIKKLYPKADLILPVSKKIKQILINNYNLPKEKIQCMYNPYDISEYIDKSNQIIDKEYINIFKNSFVFINIGRLSDPKGQWYLLRSFTPVVKKHPHAKLIIFGSGELEKKLKNLIIDLKLEKNVYLMGVHDNPFKYMKKSNCVVSTSLWEGFGNVFIEALSLNLPIISTDCNYGPREILCPNIYSDQKIKYPYFGKYGILTKPFKIEHIWNNLNQIPLTNCEIQLSNLMCKIIENPKISRKYSSGINRAKEFNIDNIMCQWKKILKL